MLSQVDSQLSDVKEGWRWRHREKCLKLVKFIKSQFEVLSDRETDTVHPTSHISPREVQSAAFSNNLTVLFFPRNSSRIF